MSTPTGNENLRSDSMERGYETTDAAVGKLYVYAGLLILLVVGALILSNNLLSELESAASKGESTPHPFAAERQEPPAPRLQVTPAADIAEHRAIEERMTNSYQWIDRDEGIVRIPVERAMELLVERKGRLR